MRDGSRGEHARGREQTDGRGGQRVERAQQHAAEWAGGLRGQVVAQVVREFEHRSGVLAEIGEEGTVAGEPLRRRQTRGDP